MLAENQLAHEDSITGTCFMLKSMPINEMELDNISLLSPFNQLLDSFEERVKPGNPEMIPFLDLSNEAIEEFYEMEDFMYGQERFEREQTQQNLQL